MCAAFASVLFRSHAEITCIVSYCILQTYVQETQNIDNRKTKDLEEKVSNRPLHENIVHLNHQPSDNTEVFNLEIMSR